MTNPIPSTDIRIQVAVPGPFLSGLDYLVPATLATGASLIGCRVKVPLRNREVIALVIGQNAGDDDGKLKPILELLDTDPLLNEQELKLLGWASRYYHEPIGEVVMTALPKRLRQGEAAQPKLLQRLFLTELGAKAEIPARASAQLRLWQALKQDFDAQGRGLALTECRALANSLRSFIEVWLEQQWVVQKEQGCLPDKPLQPSHKPTLNAEQQAALETFQCGDGFAAFLLQGVTGSGKTEVYLAMIETVLAQGKQALVLVPEIGLTPQMVRRFEAYLQAPVVAMHSGLNDSERHCAWYSMKTGQAKVLLGTRSALFTPMQNLGLCIMDEEHDLSYKQQDGFRYSARDLLVQRAFIQQVPVVLGSATPSLETLANAKSGRYQWLKLKQRAAGALMPAVRLLDIRGEKIQAGVSAQLRHAMGQHLQRGQQVLLFLNRRGFAPVLMCHDCGWQAACPSCDANMTYHQTAQGGFLQCHHCDTQIAEPSACPNCHTETPLLRIGQGTERLQETIEQWFPEYKVLRIDRDSTRLKGAMEQLTREAEQGDADILLGTQMLAKGHHFPKVTLVGLLEIDQGLFSIDYRGTERLAQLILQVSGRAGRGEQAGEVLIQTHHPDHPLLKTLIQSGYNDFAQQALAERSMATLPPYSYQILVRAEAHQPEDAWQFLQALKLGVEVQAQAVEQGEAVSVWGPVSAPMLRRQGRFRYQLMLNCQQRKPLHQIIERLHPHLLKSPLARKVRWNIDIDPQEMM